MVERGTSVILCITLLLVSSNRLNAEDNENKISDAINSFGIQLFKELTKTNPNLICSGYSAATVLSMLLVGARTDTAQELKKTLGYDATGLSDNQVEDSYHQILTKQRNHNGAYELDIGNSMWIQSGFNVLPDFKSSVTKTFYAEEEEVDFGSPAATDQINSWVNQETKGKIPKLFDDPLGADTRLVLVNAMYFNGTWEMKFNKELTSVYPFHFNNGNSQTNIPMMNLQSHFNYGSSQDLNADLLEMPYNGNDVSMIIILPNAVDGLNSLEDRLTLESLNTAINNLRDSKVDVKIPKFNITSSLPLNQQLQDLGIKKAFLQGGADLSGIDGQRDLSLSIVIQKATIEVDEEGTVAAVATGGGIRTLAILQETASFVADHPFLYLIRDKPTGLFLFMGRMTQPPK